MPQSSLSLDAIARALRQLAGAIEQVKPGVPVDRSNEFDDGFNEYKPVIEVARDDLFKLMMPSKTPIEWVRQGGETDITQSNLDRKTRALLKELRLYLIECPVVSRARNENDETIVYLQQVLDQLQPACTHSMDFTSVTWFGKPYSFSKGQQAESVRLLLEAWENGTPSLSEKTIGDELGSASDSFRLIHVFSPTNKRTGKRKAHPAWGTMIKSAGKGKFALSPP